MFLLSVEADGKERSRVKRGTAMRADYNVASKALAWLWGVASAARSSPG